MKNLVIIILLALFGQIALAQDTVYINRDKATALFFASPVKLLDKQNESYRVSDKGNGVLSVKAIATDFKTNVLHVQDMSSKIIYRIPITYSYRRAGRRISYGSSPIHAQLIERPVRTDDIIARQLAEGKRKDIATHKKSGGVKAWINKITLAGNRIFFRLDVRNRSNLPYDIDFVRFYVRDRKTVDRMATHEQEIVPLYSTLRKKTSVIKGNEVARVFAFKRFSLSDDEALFVEVYERAGNRHLYLQIRQGDLDDMKVIPLPQTAPALASNNI